MADKEEVKELKSRIETNEMQIRYITDDRDLYKVFLFLFGGVLFTLLIIALIVTNDNIDKDKIGRFICERNNATVIDIQYSYMPCAILNCEIKSLKIVCSKNNEIPIEDHYLYILGENDNGAKR